MNYTSNSVEDTLNIAFHFAKQLKAGDVVLLYGNLGAGKTHFTKGIAKYFGINQQKVSSPTFTLINEYGGDIPIYHFDCYRIKNENEALEFGAEEYIYGDGISIIEWPDKIINLLPENAKEVHIEHTGQESRIIRIL